MCPVPEPRTKYASVVADGVRNYFTERMDDLGIAAVYYGDQMRVPLSPTLCVEPATINRIVNNTGCATENEFALNVILYDARLGDVEGIQFDLDKLAETVMDEINDLGQLDGRVIYIHATAIEYGYLIKSNRLLRADRIIVTAKTKTEL
jgi:hypothetical protein